MLNIKRRNFKTNASGYDVENHWQIMVNGVGWQWLGWLSFSSASA
jgi:hypothetical protein